MKTRKVQVYVPVCIEFQVDEAGNVVSDGAIAAYVDSEWYPRSATETIYDCEREQWVIGTFDLLCEADEIVGQALANLDYPDAAEA